MMFSGFRSRCTIPAPCAFASPSVTCAAIATSRFAGTAPSARTSRSVCPSTISIAMNDAPPDSPMSWIVTMLG